MIPEPLELPISLEGDWEHAVFLSYGIDVAFFENALMAELPPQCCNRLVLVDGQRFADECERLTRTGLTRYINRRYTLAGIFLPQHRAAHAKIALLTSPGHGRLLVGSGNIGMQGYVSGGELFTRYDLDAEDPNPQSLAAILATVEMLNELFERDYIDDTQAIKHLRRLRERTPWLYAGRPDTPVVDSPVHHNLDTPLLETFVSMLRDAPVEELWVMAPFHDEGLLALRAALNSLDPTQVNVLIQDGSTSLDPRALVRLLEEHAGRISVCNCARTDCKRPPYLHAKLLLAKTAERAVCLQGSPNSTIVAMLRATNSSTPGNFEAANLLEGPRDAFDHLLNALDRTNVTDEVATLDIRYQGSNEGEAESEVEEEARFVLTSARWRDDRLWVTLRGDPPPLGQSTLLIDGRLAAGSWDAATEQAGEFQLDEHSVTVPTGPFQVRLAWGEGQSNTTNAVYVVDLAALDREMESSGSSRRLDQVGALELEDKELIELLGDLEEALILDIRSIWQPQQGKSKRAAPDDERAVEIAYEEIDYDRLKQHPKVQQYVRARSWREPHESTRLGLILSSILAHFQELGDAEFATRRMERAVQRAQEAGVVETEEEREAEASVHESQARDMERRIRDALKRFVKRYLDGVQSPRFRELAGPRVLSRNYSIFSHILWRLMAKSRLEPDEILQALVANWAWFWGDGDETDYIDTVDADARKEIAQWLEDDPASVYLLAALAFGNDYCEGAGDESLRSALRDQARRILVRLPAGVSKEVIDKAWRALDEIMPDTAMRPPDLAESISRLCSFETHAELVAWLRERYGIGPQQVRFQKQVVKIAELEYGDHHVRVLTLDAEKALDSPDDAHAIIARWMRVEPLAYYRVHRPDLQDRGRVAVMAYYVPKKRSGLYYRSTPSSQEHELMEVIPPPQPWDEVLQEISELARLIDAELSMDVVKSLVGMEGRG